MRWRIVLTILLVLILGLLAGLAHFWWGWWRSSHRVITENSTDYTDQSEPATLDEVLASARQALDEIRRKIHDYSANIVKRERVVDTVIEKKMRLKLRGKPFSVYLYFIDVSNENVKGREVLYVEGQNDNKMLVHTPGLLSGVFTLPLDPNGVLAMRGEHYPITEIGIANLCRQLIKRGESAVDPSKVQVRRHPRAHVQNRPCAMLEVTFPVEEKGYRAYLAHIFVDDQLHVPLCVRVYGLPDDAGQERQIIEEYTYLDLKINNGYTDADFDPKNPEYKFSP